MHLGYASNFQQRIACLAFFKTKITQSELKIKWGSMLLIIVQFDGLNNEMILYLDKSCKG